MPDSSMHDRAAPSGSVAAITTDFDRDVHCVLGLPFDAVTLDALAERVRGAPKHDGSCLVSTPNVNFVIGSRRDRALRDSVLRSDLSVVDGMPLLWIAKVLRIPIPERAAGSDLFEWLQRPSVEPLSVFFFGGNDGVAERACVAVNAQSSGLVCNGFHAPGHGTIAEMSGPETIASINASGADFLVVALGASKGQAWIVNNWSQLRVPVVSHLGAVVNFLAGNVRRAPKLLQSTGLEWLWRIKEEPGLWRRYAGDGLVLFELVVTRVLPALARQAWNRAVPRTPLPAHVSTVRQAVKATIALTGDWSGHDLVPLRRALADATRVPSAIIVDLAAATSLDSATVGLLLLLKGHQIKIGEPFVVGPTSRSVTRQIFLMGAEHLHDAA